MPADNIQSLIRTRRIIYLLVAAAIIVPYIVRMPIPAFHAQEESRKVFDLIESLPAGSRMLIPMEFDPNCEAELRPMAEGILRHCFRKKVVPVLVTTNLIAPSLVTDICQKIAKEAGAVSGKDWVFLGFRPGLANVVIAMGENIPRNFETDNYGQSTRDMPALAGVNSLKDLSLITVISLGNTVDMWIQYGSDRHKVPLAAGVTAVMAPDLYPYLNTGQVKGILAGLRGAADYELLLHRSDDASKGMQVQSVAHGLLIALIVGANVRFLFRRAQGKEA